MAVMQENAGSFYFGYAELGNPHSDTFVMRKESKFPIKVSKTFDNSAYWDTKPQENAA